MRYQNRFAGGMDRIERRPIAAMRNIDRHSNLVHARDDLQTKLAQARISRIRRSATQPVVNVRELGDALPEVVAVVDIVDTTKMLRVLLADQDSYLAKLLGAREITRSIHAQKAIRMRRDKSVQALDVLHRTLVHVAFGEPYGWMKNSDAGAL